MDVTQLFCEIDDFVKVLENKNDPNLLISRTKNRRGTSPQMSLSEIMTIAVLYHSSNYKNFKSFYHFLREQKRSEFPSVLSYSRFVEWIPYCLFPLTAFLQTKMGESTGINYVDSTTLPVCKNIRIPRNKVFKDIAARGKSSMGWFFGFKLHIIINEKGELLSFAFTKGNVHDIVPLNTLCKEIKGKLYGDKGYCSKKATSELLLKGIELFTNVRSNMKKKLMSAHDKILLRKRFVIETVNDVLKNGCNIDHSRHRSPMNFLVNLVAGLISYTYQEKKPSIKWSTGPLLLE